MVRVRLGTFRPGKLVELEKSEAECVLGKLEE